MGNSGCAGATVKVHFRLREAGRVVDTLSDRGVGKNEAISVAEDAGGIDSLAFLFVEVIEPGGFLEGGGAAGFGVGLQPGLGGYLARGFGFLLLDSGVAGGLELAELFEIGLCLAMEARFVEGEEVEALRIGGEGAGGGEGWSTAVGSGSASSAGPASGLLKSLAKMLFSIAATRLMRQWVPAMEWAS